MMNKMITDIILMKNIVNSILHLGGSEKERIVVQPSKVMLNIISSTSDRKLYGIGGIMNIEI